jgi:hypothetical protein
LLAHKRAEANYVKFASAVSGRDGGFDRCVLLYLKASTFARALLDAKAALMKRGPVF